MQQLGRCPENLSRFTRLVWEKQEATLPWLRGKAANCRHASLSFPVLSTETLLCRRIAKKAVGWGGFVVVNFEKCKFSHLLAR